MSQSTTHPDAEAIDGLNHYSVSLVVDEVSESEIIVKLYKDRSTRHMQGEGTRLYKSDSGEWRCILHDNYAVVDKALDILNDD